MEDLSTFLELPLQRDPYLSKSKFRAKKPPLKILITEANNKIAWHLMFKICSGQVFGSDQEVILHLTYSKGKRDSKSISTEFYLCGFPLLLDVVINNDPEKIYENVDVVVTITLFEELSGFPNHVSLFRHVLFTAHVATNMAKYAKSDSKLVICSPSTKGSIILLTVLKQLNLITRDENVSSVTILDETIAKSLIAAKLKTTTTQIKNIVIWGATHADVRNGTVFTYPSEDKGRYKKVHIPLVEAVGDDNWVQSDLLNYIHKRVIESHFVSQGMAVAAATATHLKLLFQGSDFHEEILSMGVIVPSEQPYALSPSIGFSLPVTTENGRVTVKENVPAEVYTFLTNLKDEYNLLCGQLKIVSKVLSSLPLESTNCLRDFQCIEKQIPAFLHSNDAKLKQIMCFVPSEKEQFSNKIYIIEDGLEEQNDTTTHKFRTSIKFNL